MARRHSSTRLCRDVPPPCSQRGQRWLVFPSLLTEGTGVTSFSSPINSLMTASNNGLNQASVVEPDWDSWEAAEHKWALSHDGDYLIYDLVILYVSNKDPVIITVSKRLYSWKVELNIGWSAYQQLLLFVCSFATCMAANSTWLT